MQSGHGVTSTTNIPGVGANLVQLQPANPGQQYVTIDINNQAQLISVPRPAAPQQYITVQPGGFQVIPVQGNNNTTQYVQLQLPNMQQGGNFIQLQAVPNQTLQTQNIPKPANQNQAQTFVHMQPTNILNQNQQSAANLNQKVSIQLVQHPGAVQNNLSVPVGLQAVNSSGMSLHYQKQQPMLLSSQPSSSTSLVGTVSVGQSTPVVQIGGINSKQPAIWVGGNQTLSKLLTSPIATPEKQSHNLTNLNIATTTSTLFQAIQQAAANYPQNSNILSHTTTTTVSTNVTQKQTFSSITIPPSNLDQLVRPHLQSSQVSSPSAMIVSQQKNKKIENKPFQDCRTIVVVSGMNKQSIIIPKSQTVAPQNPMFVPITMANNVSVLTNQTPAIMASKRYFGQLPQTAALRMQQQIAPRISQTQANNAPTTIATSATASAVLNQNNNQQQQKILIPLQQTSPSTAGQQQQQQQQQQQFIFQTVQQNLVRLTSQLNTANTTVQQKKEALASTNPVPKPISRPASVSSVPITDTKPLKKPCNCTKSQCLKLYCECFANGEFCNNCNCRMCLNNIKHEAERSKAIKACLERNPYAFHPKIGKGKVKGDNERRHTKGCNCKRSGCLKNYCECYEAKILCSSLCRCSGCKNFEESDDRKTLMHLADAAEVCVLQQNAAKTKLATQIEIVPKKVSNAVKEKLPVSFMTADVSKATCGILIATAVESELENRSSVDSERSIIIEFSRCLDQIIDKSNKAKLDKR